MKRNLLSCCMILISAFVFGQKQNKATVSSFVSDRQTAAMIVLPYSPEVVIDALQQFQSGAGFYSKKYPSSNELLQNTSLIKNYGDKADFIFKVGPSRQDDSQSEVFLMLNSDGTEGSYSDRPYQMALNQALGYLDKLAVVIDVFAMENRDKLIKQQQWMLAREQAKQGKCEKRCNKLGEKKEWTQQKLAANKKSTIKRNNSLERRIAESQSTLAYQKAAVEKRRNNLASLTDRKKVEGYYQTD